MNISTTQYLFSSINHNKPYIDSDNLFYIGTGIGLAGGLLTWCVIAYFKYQKKKRELESLSNDVAI
jgi:hypothetical protein